MSLRLDMLNKSCTRRKLTRKEQRDLDFEISFMQGVVRRDPGFTEAWRVLSEDFSRRGKFDEAFKADEQLARMQPDDPGILYNLACSYALLKNVEAAVGVLGQAIAKGFTDFKWLLKDPDLVNLRKSAIFKKFWIKISALEPDAR